MKTYSVILGRNEIAYLKRNSDTAVNCSRNSHKKLLEN